MRRGGSQVEGVGGLLLWCGNWLAGSWAEPISELWGSSRRVCVKVFVLVCVCERARVSAGKGERIDHQICSSLWKGWRQDRVC